jgi:AAA+ superfamily predicted ATPase
LVNTTPKSKQYFYFGGEPSPRKREEAVWGDIDAAFATPTTATDDASEYTPTQILAEALRDAGFDGVGYRSAYGQGHNVVLFDVNGAEQRNGLLVRVKDVKFDFKVDDQYSYAVDSKKPQASAPPSAIPK